MENASKALLIAGGVLLAILLITLFRFSWGLFSNYMFENDKLADIEDVAKFNQQFTNYDRDDVEGYELISLANQIIDYNERKSTEGHNDEKYTPITLNVDLNSRDLIKEKFCADSTIRLFNIKVKNYSATDFNNMVNRVKIIEDVFGGAEETTKIAKDRGSIFLEDETDFIKWKTAADKFNAYSKKAKISVNASSTAQQIKSQIDSYKLGILTYYEYYMFKRGIFQCTEIKYNETSGRVSNIEFVFTGELH